MGTPTTSQHNIFDSEKLSQFFLVLRTVFEPSTFGSKSDALPIEPPRHPIVKNRAVLAKLAFSGRHASVSVWILTQKYNAVLKDFREQLKWIALFFCKDRDSFADCLRENDVIEDEAKRKSIREQLKNPKPTKLIMKTDQPAGYTVIM